FYEFENSCISIAISCKMRQQEFDVFTWASPRQCLRKTHEGCREKPRHPTPPPGEGGGGIVFYVTRTRGWN
ncbi:hypothetical protein PFISCL1PPCAC_20915, partial [Pristionchus fissidentatus]